ncbi:MAG: hypothetical protein K0R57_6208 [Paenibacillaceae bacterium]|jgi:hypothetical protein|nr:hypothetical protein [Paenibacillaceae bacterium]
MMRRFGLRAAAGLAGILAWIVLAVAWFPFPVSLILAVTASACVYYVVKSDRAEREARARERMIGLVNHYRHDWMNDLQIVFGYIQLRKYDILPDYMDKIKTSALHESYLCKLGNPPLIVYLLERRVSAVSVPVVLELDKEVDLRRVDMDEQALFRLVSGVIERICRHAVHASGEQGLLSLGFDEDGEVLLADFLYRGEGDWAALREEMTVFLGKYKQGFEIREQEYGEEQAVVALALPFRI